jgi:hypothetical protein
VLSNCASKLGPKLIEMLPIMHRPQFKQTMQRLTLHQDAHCRKHAQHINRLVAGEAVTAV